MYDPSGRGQLPIRYVKVDWGDGNEQEITSSFGNYGSPEDFICDSSNWGKESARCVNEPLEFFHIYRARDIVDGLLCEEDNLGDDNCRVCKIEISAYDNLAEITGNDSTPRSSDHPRTRTRTALTTVRVCKKSE